jgi:GntR family transcriptional repressor for pyruvate dehydrogenase complex
MYDPLKKITLREMIVERIKELIIAQKIKPGEKLPSERELARQMRVSRSAVREAIMVLSSLRLVEVRQGEGTFVNKITIDSIVDQTILGLLVAKDINLKLFEVRRAIETNTAAIAAERATPSDLEKIFQQMVLMEDFISQRSRGYLKADFDFHLAIAKATQNEIFVHILSSFAGSLVKCWEQTLFDKQILERAQNYHRKIFSCIEARDSEGATEAMHGHLDFLEEALEQLEGSLGEK